jgi:hypothetical protein
LSRMKSLTSIAFNSLKAFSGTIKSSISGIMSFPKFMASTKLSFWIVSRTQKRNWRKNCKISSTISCKWRNSKKSNCTVKTCICWWHISSHPKWTSQSSNKSIFS